MDVYRKEFREVLATSVRPRLESYTAGSDDRALRFLKWNRGLIENLETVLSHPLMVELVKIKYPNCRARPQPFTTHLGGIRNSKLVQDALDKARKLLDEWFNTHTRPGIPTAKATKTVWASYHKAMKAPGLEALSIFRTHRNAFLFITRILEEFDRLDINSLTMDYALEDAFKQHAPGGLWDDLFTKQNLTPDLNQQPNLYMEAQAYKIICQHKGNLFV